MSDSPPNNEAPAAAPVDIPEPAPAQPDPGIDAPDDDSQDELREDPPVPDSYMPPTTDGTGFIDAHALYKQRSAFRDLSFDIAALNGDERRQVSFRLQALNVPHRIEGDALIATTESASAVQGQLDALAAAGPLVIVPTPETEVAEWMQPVPVEAVQVVDEPVVERTEPEEITVPASADVDEVIQEADDDDDEIVFDLASLSTEERRHLGMRLTGAGIGHIWEVATDLVVSVNDAPMIERYVEEVKNPDGFADEEISAFESDEEVDDEEVYAAMSNLYVAADRLMQRPTDPSIRTQFYDATDDVDGLPAPFGFDPRVWSQVQSLANTIADAMDAEVDEEAVATDARTLRQLLVNYV